MTAQMRSFIRENIDNDNPLMAIIILKSGRTMEGVITNIDQANSTLWLAEVKDLGAPKFHDDMAISAGEVAAVRFGAPASFPN